MQMKSLPVLLAFCLLLIGLVSCSPTRRSSHARGVFHTVLPGQNLYRISLTYGIELGALARINGISNPHSIKAGQKIFIPGARTVLDVPIVRPSPSAFPFLPVPGVITSYFGARRNGHRHTGIDISAPRGTPVRAVWAGVVIFSGRLGDYGNTVKIEHANGLVTLYAHNEHLLVRRGKKVKSGEQIATVGRSGHASGYHVHFEIRRHGKPIDPLSLQQ